MEENREAAEAVRTSYFKRLKKCINLNIILYIITVTVKIITRKENDKK
jgi:hypothetical protein